MTFLFRAAGQRPGTANRPGKAQQAALQLLAPRRMRAAFSGQHIAKITVILTQRRRNVKPCPPAARPLPSAPKPLCRNDCKRLFYHSLPRLFEGQAAFSSPASARQFLFATQGRVFGSFARKRPTRFVRFSEFEFFMQSERLFFKKPLYFGRKSGMLYPTGAYLGYNASYPFFCAPISILLFYAIFFIYLLIIYPACPPMRARRRRPYLHGPPPFFFCCKLSSLLQNRSDPGSAPLPAPDQRQRGRTHWNPV